ncbi:gamma-glutamyltransferase family protein [Hydrogenophaga sp. NFH-34]|uniref:gamma-glutamyltransferase family protein n=1 Tax=Hydrogenophaga sp. NFH-34 TaxID=2744446 RepID=UPI001F35D178|nr:gamma-glutamyltransferase family protein [Hydrogenophaga sp. NFH-34]
MLATSPHGLVTSPHPLASEAGRQVLAQGGNAIEATLAMAAVLAVVYPHFTGLGGDAFWLIAEPDGAVRALSGIGQAAQHCAGYSGSIPVRGAASALTTAAAVDSWGQAFDISRDRWGGRQSWPALLAPAIAHAEDGVPVSQSQRFWAAQRAAEIPGWPGFSAAFPSAGQTLRQPPLARTLTRLAEAGARDFYEGEIAQRLAHGLAAAGSPLTLSDLQRTRARDEAPLKLPYRGGELFTFGPPTQGISTLQAMGMLAHVDFGGIAEGSAMHYHLMIEAIKLAFMDRDRWVADPEHVQVPVADLLDPAYLAAQAQRISREKARPWPHLFRHGDTVFMGAADAMGRGVSLLQTIYFDWGSGVVAGDTGVLWHNRGAAFSLDPAHPNVLRPGKRPFHTLNPGVYLEGGRPRLLYGTQGADGQPQTLVALLTRLIDYGLDPLAAMARPRFLLGKTFSDARDTLKLEADVGDDVVAALGAVGHEISLIPAQSPLAGQPGVIRLDAATGLCGAHDPRSEGLALGV